MLPENIQNNVILRPKTRNSKEGKNKILELLSIGYSMDNINLMIISQEDAMSVLHKLDIVSNKSFYEYYLNGLNESSYDLKGDLLYGLNEILEDYKNPFWREQYPNLTDRYLQLSSIEGEYSYFYDKETDALYGVDWGEMDDFMAGKIDPLFTSFYDFLEWYYSEDDS